MFMFKIEALPEVVRAVEGKVEVFLDGGIRDGTDVLKALALGAKMVWQSLCRNMLHIIGCFRYLWGGLHCGAWLIVEKRELKKC